MRLEKQNIHMNREKCRANIQFTLDEDINIPDGKVDIARVVCSRAQIQMENVNNNEKKVQAGGKCCFSIMYSGEGDRLGIENITGDIPFNEVINMDELTPEDIVRCTEYVEDFTVRVINSRKISIKAVINIEASAESIYDEEIASGADDAMAQCLYRTINYSGLALNGSDIFRVKDEFEIPRNKPEVNRILWKDISLRTRQIRLMEDGFSIKGELCVFVLYDTYEEGIIEWYETTVPFAGKIDYPGIHEDMVSDITLNLTGGNIELKSNSDGEERLISVEAVMGIDIRVYEEKSVPFLADVYSLNSNIDTVMKNTGYEQMLTKNNAKCRVGDRVNIDASNGRIMQICRVDGDIRMDEITADDEGILAEGAVIMNILYITSDDKKPIETFQAAVPFSQRIDIEGSSSDIVYRVNPNMEQISATVLGNDEVEIRAVINLDTIAFRKVNEDFITDLNEDNNDTSWLTDFPGIIGYIANSEEALWDIAKKYRTRTDDIKQTNNITSDVLHRGDKILITR